MEQTKQNKPKKQTEQKQKPEPQPQPRGQSQEPEVKIQPEKEAKPKNLEFNKEKYDLFLNLYFTELSTEGRLKPEWKAKLAELAKEVKQYDGKVANKDKTMHNGVEIIRIAKGYPVPKEYFDKIPDVFQESCF